MYIDVSSIYNVSKLNKRYLLLPIGQCDVKLLEKQEKIVTLLILLLSQIV